MTYWNYRICKHRDGTCGLHEVYYRDDGVETAMTSAAIDFMVDEEEGPEGIVHSLERALDDARNRPVFVVPERWGIPTPSGAAEAGSVEEELAKEMVERSQRMFQAIAIGTEFHSGGGRWRCTDKGTRTIIAIRLDQEDESWYAGPPYAVVETVFDEYDLEGVALTREEWVADFGDD